MKLLTVGIILKLCVLFSVHYMFKPIKHEEEPEVCQRKGRGAARAVLLISQGLGSLGGRARGPLQYQPTLTQTDELYPLLTGIPDYVVLSEGDCLDSILKKVDVVVYVGPAGIIHGFKEVSYFLSFTYPKSSLSLPPNSTNDEFVFTTVHSLLENTIWNDTLNDLLNRKVLFVLYLLSVALGRLRYPINITHIHETENFVRTEIESLQNKIDHIYSDDDTVYISVPHWSITEDKNPMLSVWGRGTSKKFAPAINLEDVCPLLSSLLGIPIPLRSYGRIHQSYLNLSQEERATALACNALQLHGLTQNEDSIERERTVLSIVKHLKDKEYARSSSLSEEVIRATQLQLRTSKIRFDRTVFSLVIVAMVGWILALATEPMMPLLDYHRRSRKQFLVFMSVFILSAVFEFLYVFYTGPKPFIQVVGMNFSLLPFLIISMRYKEIWNWFLKSADMRTFLRISAMLILEEILVLLFSGGFSTIILISAVGSLPLLHQFRTTPFVYSLGWYGCCAAIIGLLNFPRYLLQSRKKVLNLAATFWLCFGQSTVFFFELKNDSIISQILVFYMTISIIIGNTAQFMPSVPVYVHYLSWTLFTALVFPFLGKEEVLSRLILTSLSFGPFLFLLSNDIESFSFFILMLFVSCWAFLERSFMERSEESWGDLRRGALLVFSCTLGYLLMGRLEDHNPASILTAFLPLHVFWNNHIPYYFMLWIKYMSVFTIVMTVYISLISSKWKRDMGYVYGLIFIELMCLRSLLRSFLFSNDLIEVISDHIFINMFGLSFMLSNYLGLLFSIKYVKEEVKSPNEIEFFSMDFVQ